MGDNWIVYKIKIIGMTCIMFHVKHWKKERIPWRYGDRGVQECFMWNNGNTDRGMGKGLYWLVCGEPGGVREGHGDGRGWDEGEVCVAVDTGNCPITLDCG